MQDIAKNLIRECGCDPADFADITPDLTASPTDFLPASTVGQVIRRLVREARWLTHPEWRPIPDMRDLPAIADDGHWPSEQLYYGRPSLCSDGWHYLPVCVDRRQAGEETCGSGSEVLRMSLGLVFAAAAEVCPDAAIRGECPGVDPAAFRAFLEAQPAAV